RAPGAGRVTVARPEDAATIAHLDAAAFGADRSPVLEPLLAAHGALVDADGRGYAVVQRNAASAVVGPWVALDEVVARDLLDAALAAAVDEPVSLFVPSINVAAVSLATAAGFVARRSLRHMIRGAGALPSSTLFGRANLGQG
ncbi:MAG: hypothetical protein M3N49_12750, partial [Candidatus Eremiobacteraeota bacterium]|nr:hypothetical protein [Candidatus Eremiobacteraeota bacterium]